MNRVVKFSIFIVCSIVLIMGFITLLLPSAGRVVKQKEVNVRKEIIMGELVNVRNYGLWYPWLQMDTGIAVSYGSGGRRFSWSSRVEKNDLCTYQLTGTQGDSVVHFKFVYGSAPPITGAYILRPSADSTSTTIIWYMNMKSGWTPWWRFYGAMMDKMNGPLLETGLTNLKVICEKQRFLPAAR